MRPPNSDEKQTSVEIFDPQRKCIQIRKDFNERKTFQLDSLMDPNITQSDVFNQVASVLEGFNGTIFTYGQTGTGKTHTMVGSYVPISNEQRGIIPRSLEYLFQRIKDDEGSQNTYDISIQDLLEPDNAEVKIREDPIQGVFVSGLQWVSINSTKRGMQVFSNGEKNRSTSFTKLNAHSSRSHAVFMVKIEKRKEFKIQNFDQKASNGINTGYENGNGNYDQMTQSMLYLVDLAGSERVKKSQVSSSRLDEAKKINFSLAALGNCIHALTEQKTNTHVPFRDSKLTRILSDSLGGNSKTALVVTIGPSKEHVEETIMSLQFAQRAMKVENIPVINKKIDYRVMNVQLQSELDEVNDQLTKLQIRYCKVLELLEEKQKENENLLKNRGMSNQNKQSESETAQIQSMKQAYEEIIKRKEQEHNKLLEEIDQIMSAQEQQLDNLKKQNQDLTEQLDSLSNIEKDKIELEQRIMELNEDIEKQRKKEAKLKVQYTVKISKLKSEFEKDSFKIIEQVNELEKQLEKNEIKKIRSKNKEIIQQLEVKQQALEGENKILGEQVYNLNSDTSEFQSQLTHIQDENQTMLRQIDELNAIIKEKEQILVDSKSTQQQDHQQITQNFNEQIKLLKQRSQEEKDQLVQKQQQLIKEQENNIAKQKKNHEKKIELMQLQIDTMKQEKLAANEKILDTKQQNEKQMESIDELNKQVLQLKQILKEKQEIIDLQTTEIEEQLDENKNQTDYKEKLRQQILNLQNESRTQIQALRDQISQKVTIQLELEDQIKNLQQLESNLSKQIQDLQTQNSDQQLNHQVAITEMKQQQQEYKQQLEDRQKRFQVAIGRQKSQHQSQVDDLSSGLSSYLLDTLKYQVEKETLKTQMLKYDKELKQKRENILTFSTSIVKSFDSQPTYPLVKYIKVEDQVQDLIDQLITVVEIQHQCQVMQAQGNSYLNSSTIGGQGIFDQTLGGVMNGQTMMMGPSMICMADNTINYLDMYVTGNSVSTANSPKSKPYIMINDQTKLPPKQSQHSKTPQQNKNLRFSYENQINMDQLQMVEKFIQLKLLENIPCLNLGYGNRIPTLPTLNSVLQKYHERLLGQYQYLSTFIQTLLFVLQSMKVQNHSQNDQISKLKKRLTSTLKAFEQYKKSNKKKEQFSNKLDSAARTIQRYWRKRKNRILIKDSYKVTHKYIQEKLQVAEAQWQLEENQIQTGKFMIQKSFTQVNEFMRLLHKEFNKKESIPKIGFSTGGLSSKVSRFVNHINQINNNNSNNVNNTSNNTSLQSSQYE
ncbi:UNKNOWN [Stylonychia lemnae]|uniref:Kinesin motor domain-containing protein n=1 Tax=Stylonychia lemnae TaxID=5949 RepID=A0A078AEP5_STYLE|nr:UNKNOWN [Stylonychia lemnae]|eukprot:CDW79952.1 UNKNOWN [Stylonychia lemnae]